MPGIAKIIRAIENCVDVPKCRNCPWETCEEIDHKSVEVPLDLMISVLSVIREQNKKIRALKKELKITDEELKTSREEMAILYKMKGRRDMIQ